MIRKLRDDFEEELMIVMGVICVALNVHIYSVFPLLFGIFMLARGLHGCWVGWKNGDAASREQKQLPISIMIVAVAVGIMILQDRALLIAGMFWGLTGLYRSAGFLNELLYRISHKEKYIFAVFIEFAVEAPLSMFLIFDTVNSIEHHIVILGTQLIVYGVIGMAIEAREKIGE